MLHACKAGEDIAARICNCISKLSCAEQGKVTQKTNHTGTFDVYSKSPHKNNSWARIRLLGNNGNITTSPTRAPKHHNMQYADTAAWHMCRRMSKHDNATTSKPGKLLRDSLWSPPACQHDSMTQLQDLSVTHGSLTACWPDAMPTYQRGNMLTCLHVHRTGLYTTRQHVQHANMTPQHDNMLACQQKSALHHVW